jgi:hypothetical protein
MQMYVAQYDFYRVHGVSSQLMQEDFVKWPNVYNSFIRRRKDMHMICNDQFFTA